MIAVERVVERLREGGCRPVRSGGGWKSRCPGHDDHKPSLAIAPAHEFAGAVLKCYAGCQLDDLLTALNLATKDLFDEARDRARGYVVTAEYQYVDEQGGLLYVVERRQPKDFRQRRPDGRGGWTWKLGDVRRVLYLLPEVLAAVEAGRVVFVVEGEADCDRLTALGVAATCNPGGAGKWRDDYSDTLTGATVVVVADRDEPGRKHAAAVVASLTGKAASVVVVEAAAGKDVSDHLAAGHTLADLVPLDLDLDRLCVPDDDRLLDVRRLVLTTASSVKPERQRWLWADRIPAGALCLLAGREGLGKSTIAVDLAAQVTRGELAGELHGQPRDVLIVATEDNRSTTIVPRLIAAGADLDRVHFVDVEEDGLTGAPVFPVDTDRLADAARARRAALVILDAATSVIDGHLDGDRDRQMRQALEPLGRLAADLDASVLGVVHFGKRADADTGKLILGSIAWSQVARSVLAVAVDEDSGVLLVQPTKHNLGPGDVRSIAARIVPATVPTGDGPTSVGRVEWLGEVDADARDHLGRREGDTDDEQDRDEAGQWLSDYLKGNGGEASAKDIFKAGAADGHATHVLKRAKRRVGVGTQRVSLGASGAGSWVWRLDPDPREQQGSKGTGARARAPLAPLRSLGSDEVPAPTPDPPTCSTCGTAIWPDGLCVTCEVVGGSDAA